MKYNFQLFSRSNLLMIAFFILALIPLTSQRLEVVFVIFFVILLLMYSLTKKENDNYRNGKNFILNGLLFIVLLTTLLDGIDVKTFKRLEQMFSLLIFPLLFYLLSKEKLNNLNKAFELWKKVFVIATLILSIICFVLFCYYSNPKYKFLDTNFFRNAILDSNYFSRHPIYISIFLNVASLIIVDLFFKSKLKLRILYTLIFCVFLVLLFLLSTKMAIISFIFCFILLLFFNLKIKYFIIGLTLIFSFSLIFISSTPSKLNGFSKIFEKNILLKKERYNSIYVHKETIVCSYKIFKENLVSGVGIENSELVVNSCVRENYKFNPEISYNSHNQYLSFGLHSGLLAFILLIFILVYAIQNSFVFNKLLFVIIIYFSILFLTENILERQTGIILFSFILNFIPLLKPKYLNS